MDIVTKRKEYLRHPQSKWSLFLPILSSLMITASKTVLIFLESNIFTLPNPWWGISEKRGWGGRITNAYLCETQVCVQ